MDDQLGIPGAVGSDVWVMWWMTGWSWKISEVSSSSSGSLYSLTRNYLCERYDSASSPPSWGLVGGTCLGKSLLSPNNSKTLKMISGFE